MQWVYDGDQISRFFHNFTGIHKHFNSISQIPDLDNTVFTDCAGIEHGFLNFYSRLWSNSSNDSFFDILNALPNDLQQLLSLDCEFITWDVTHEEVHLTVLELPSGRSRGLMVLMLNFILFFA